MQVHVLFLGARFFTFVLFKLLLGAIGVMKLYHPISILYLISYGEVEILYSLFYIFFKHQTTKWQQQLYIYISKKPKKFQEKLVSNLSKSGNWLRRGHKHLDRTRKNTVSQPAACCWKLHHFVWAIGSMIWRKRASTALFFGKHLVPWIPIPEIHEPS